MELIRANDRYRFYRGDSFTTDQAFGLFFVTVPRRENLSGLLKNENEWYNNVREGKIPGVSAPMQSYFNEDTGGISTTYLCDGRWLGQEDMDRVGIDTEFFDSHLSSFVDLFHTIREARGVCLPNDDVTWYLGDQRFMNRFCWFGQVLHRKWEFLARRYAKNVNRDCGDLLGLVERGPISETSLNHGNLMPYHVFLERGNLVVVSPKWATNKLPRHYDAALTVARLYTLGYPDLAKEILTEYISAFPGDGRDGVEIAIRPLLAVRAIGQLRDARLKSDRSLEDRFAGEVVSSTIFD